MMDVLLAAGLMLQPVGTFLPDASDVRIQSIARVPGESGWPFVADSGKLACVRMFPKSVVLFMPDGSTEANEAIALDVNPFAMMINNWGSKNVLLPYKTPEELIKRVAPFVAQGLMLCKQENGPVVPGSDL